MRNETRNSAQPVPTGRRQAQKKAARQRRSRLIWCIVRRFLLVFFSVILGAALGLLAYELLCFFFALFVEQTSLRRIGIACMTCLLTGAVLPILYPIFVSIGKIGGETWKE